MLLGLMGVLLASSVADVFLPSEDALGAGDENGDGAAAPEAASHGDFLADTHESSLNSGADILDSATEPASKLSDVPQGAPSGQGDSSYPDLLDDEFISSDIPPLTPLDYFLDADDDGDQLAGGAGDDTLLGGAGDDWLDGLGGDDEIFGSDGDDTLIGGAGDDTVDGGDGNDSILGGSGRGLLIGGDGNDTVIGGESDDILFGGQGDDTLQGGWGNDVLFAGEGNDLLMGGSGNDTLVGYSLDGDGNDIDGADFLNGGDGDDVLILGSGDMASGGSGGDTFVLGAWIDPEEIAQISDFEPGVDTLTIAYDGQGEAPDVSTEYDEEAGGLVVYIDGEPVAFLAGVETLDPDSVTLRAVDGGSDS